MISTLNKKTLYSNVRQNQNTQIKNYGEKLMIEDKHHISHNPPKISHNFLLIYTTKSYEHYIYLFLTRQISY